MSGFITFKEFYESHKFITTDDEGVEVYIDYGLGEDHPYFGEFVGVHEFMGKFHIERYGNELSLVLGNRECSKSINNDSQSNKPELRELATMLYFDHAIAELNPTNWKSYCGWCGASTRCTKCEAAEVR